MHTRKLVLVVVLLSAAILFFPVRSFAQESPPLMTEPGTAASSEGTEAGGTAETREAAAFSIAWEAALASKYLFMGIDYSDGKPCFQPLVGMSYGAFSASLWFNQDLHRTELNEIDAVVEYTAGIGPLSTGLGYGYYRYPHREGWDPSQEILMDLSFASSFNPSLSVHYDFDAGTGSYFTLGASREAPSPLGALSVGANLFYQSGYYDGTGIPSFEVSLSKDFPLGQFTISPSVSRFTTWENGSFRADAAVPSSWLFTLTVAQSF